MFGKSVRLAGVLAAFAFLSSAPAQSLTIGTAEFSGQFGNTFPFGTNTGNRYQQAYAASNFTGPVTITGINFFAATDSGNLARNYTGGTFTLSLSTTPLGVNTINENSNFDANLGSDNQLFTTETLTGTVDPVLTFSGAAFNYDPTQGDLLLDISVTGSASTSLAFQFDSANGGIMSRAHDFGNVFDNHGLGTEFTFGEIVSVPAPGTLVILGLGLFAIARRVA